MLVKQTSMTKSKFHIGLKTRDKGIKKTMTKISGKAIQKVLIIKKSKQLQFKRKINYLKNVLTYLS